MGWMLRNVAWYERGARGFWLMLPGFAVAFLALGLLPPELIEASSARVALGGSPLAFFLLGFLCPSRCFGRPALGAASGAIVSLAAAIFGLWAAGAQLSDVAGRMELALSGLGFCAALGMGWGAACARSAKARPKGQLAYIAAEGHPEELARAGAQALAELEPSWAQGAHPRQYGQGSWRVEFPARPGFFFAVETQRDIEPDTVDAGAEEGSEAEACQAPLQAALSASGDEPTDPSCLLALALEPGRAPSEWLGGHASGIDPMALRPAFCAALERALPGCAPRPLG